MKKLLARIIAIAPAVVLQLGWYALILSILRPHAAVLGLGLSLLSVVVVLYIMSARQESTYKTIWLMLIFAFPIGGTLMYLLFGNKRTSRQLMRRITKAREALPPVPREPDRLGAVEDVRLRQILRCLESSSGFPAHACGETKYYPLGENVWQDMLLALKKAEHFIFVEYFIIEPGKMWDSMVEIMARKAKAGVDVRVLYDDLGSVKTYSARDIFALRRKGIRCAAFNPLFFVKGSVNNRDHRKMLIVDGTVAFSGGVNLADEYINHVVRFGHWKDIGFRITGAAVENFTRMYAEIWNVSHADPIPAACFGCAARETKENAKGIVLPYYDSPFNPEPISNGLYIQLLGQATESAWFYTPYLMLGDSLCEAMVGAARRGVDVRLMVPGIGDSKIVHRMGKSYYSELLEAGIQIFEYTPGFLHAKACLVDGKIGTIGTVNLDYRSLFLHFENNALFYDAPILGDLQRDMEATQALCTPITAQVWRRSFLRRMIDGVLRIFAPLC